MEIEKLFVSLGLKAAEYAQGLQQATRDGQSWAKNYTSTISPILTKGILATVAIITTALAGIGAFAIKEASEFQAQMSGVNAILATTTEEAAALQEQALDLSLDPQLKVSATEAADAMETLARNGLTTDEILQGTTRSVILLSNATGGDFAKTADIATDVMSLFNIEAKNMEGAVDGITSVTAASKFTVDDYRLALAQAGGVAAGVGVGFDDFNATIAAISPAFASGSDAGTSFKTTLQRLIPQSTKAFDTMQDLGLITAEGANQFFDAQGNMKDMAEIAGLLNSAMGDLSEEQRLQALSTIFGTDAMRAANELSKFTEESFRDLQDTMGDTSAADIAARRIDNLKGDMEIFQSVISGLGIQVGLTLLPFLRQLVQAGSQLLSAYGPVLIGALETVVGIIQSFTTNIQEGMAPLDAFILAIQDIAPQSLLDALTNLNDNILPALSAWWTDNVQPLIDFVAQNVIWQDVLVALGLILLSVVLPALFSLLGTIVAIAAPIFILIGIIALLRQVWERDIGGIRTALTEWWETSGRPIFDQLRAWLETNIPIAIEKLTAFWNETLMPALTAGWQWIQDNLFPLLETFAAWFSENLPIAVEAFTTFWSETLLPALEKLWEFVQNSLIPLWKSWANLFKEILKKEIEIFVGVWNDVLAPALESLWKWIDGTLAPGLEKFVNDKIKPMSDGVGGVSGAVESLIGWIDRLADAVANFSWDDLKAIIAQSPAPMAVGAMGSAKAIRNLANAAIPQLENAVMGLQMQTGGGLGTVPENAFANAVAVEPRETSNVTQTFQTTIQAGDRPLMDVVRTSRHLDKLGMLGAMA